MSFDELDEDPYAVYARLRPTEPLTWLPTTGMYYALTHDLVQRLLLDDVNFVVGWETLTVFDTFGVHMMSCECAEARRIKRPHRQAFLPADILARRKNDRRIIKALIDEDAEALVKSFADYVSAKGSLVPRELVNRIPVKPDN